MLPYTQLMKNNFVTCLARITLENKHSMLQMLSQTCHLCNHTSFLHRHVRGHGLSAPSPLTAPYIGRKVTKLSWENPVYPKDTTEWHIYPGECHGRQLRYPGMGRTADAAAILSFPTLSLSASYRAPPKSLIWAAVQNITAELHFLK